MSTSTGPDRYSFYPVAVLCCEEPESMLFRGSVLCLCLSLSLSLSVSLSAVAYSDVNTHGELKGAGQMFSLNCRDHSPVLLPHCLGPSGY